MAEQLKGALILGQSGGPTSVINASAYGIIRAGLEADCITKVYGAHYGILGVLHDDLMIMDEEPGEEIERLPYTPASALGSCRYKLKDPKVDDTDCKKILETFKKYNVRYFVYNGGNDSMDTCNKISKYMREVGYDCRIMGVPKTIDNDLFGTDHCPGYGSAAKYIATSIMEVARDTMVYESGVVSIVECMGRHAGWLTAAAALANSEEPCVDLIYLPERDFDMDRFLNDVAKCYEEKGDCIVCVSEGIHYADGRFVSEAETSATDGFGHAQLGGLAAKLADVVHKKLNVKTRAIEFSLLQRCAAHLASRTDIQEAILAGRTAVQAMVAGETDKMVGFVCDRSNGYTCKTELFDLASVANYEKKMPLEWINEAGNGVFYDFVEYVRPLIQGETSVDMRSGIPRFARLKRVRAR